MNVQSARWTFTSRIPSYPSSTRRPLGELAKKGHTGWFSLRGVLRTPPADVVKQISALRTRTADEDSGFVPPSSSASLILTVLLTDLVGAPPVSGISDDGEGGLEAYWLGTNRHVQLNVPRNPEEPPTLFWDGDGSYQAEPLNSLRQLSERLRWFREA